MADDITYTSTSPAGPPNSTKQATDEHATRGHMPIVKLGYSADGDATHVPADADGVLVNLGSNNDVTVTGTVTADLGATDNAVLDAIAADGDAVQALLTTIDADTGSILSDTTAILADTANIDTNITAILADTAAIDTNAATFAGAIHVEDTAHTTADPGIQVLGVRNDTASSLAGTDGDYLPLTMASDGSLHVQVNSLPALAATTDNIGAKLDTDNIMQGTTARAPAFAAVAASSSGDNTIVAAAGASNKIRVLSYTIVAAGAVTCRWESGASGTALSGQMSFAANGGAHSAFCPYGLFETAANTLLNLELGGAVSVAGHITYVVVT